MIVISTRGATSYIASTTATEKISENWGGNSIESERKVPMLNFDAGLECIWCTEALNNGGEKQRVNVVCTRATESSYRQYINELILRKTCSRLKLLVE